MPRALIVNGSRWLRPGARAVRTIRALTCCDLPRGDNVVVANPPSAGEVAAVFNHPGLAAQIKWAQANPPDYCYAAYRENVKALGCAAYVVSDLRCRVLFFGRNAETHVEMLPGR